MPSYKLGTGIKEEIVTEAKKLIQRRLDYALLNPPITVAQMQRGAVRDLEMLTTMMELTDRGVAGLVRENNVTTALRVARIPGLERDILLEVALPETVFCMCDTRSSYHSGQSVDDIGERYYCNVELDGALFTDDERDALITWAHKVIRVRRRKTMVHRTVKAVLDHCASSGHLLARWPVLATLVVDEWWKKRLMHGPEKMHLYGWARPDGSSGRPDGSSGPIIGVLTDDLLRRMRAAEIMLLESQMLAEITAATTEGKVRATLRAFQKLPNERFA